MSHMMNYIQVSKLNSYLFKIALDHAPEPGEYDAIEGQIRMAMEQLGVPVEQVSVFPMMSGLAPDVATPQEEEKFRKGRRYLLCIMIQTEEGGFTEDHDEVAERAVRAFAGYAETEPENVAAVVLENAHLEVESRQSKPTPIPYIAPQVIKKEDLFPSGFSRRRDPFSNY